jgi:signal transduction histidine kinase
MNRSIQIHNHPFRFLLYLEWILLGFAILTSLFPTRFHRFAAFPELTICSLTIFGLMGLRLPTGNQGYKILYTAGEFILIFFTGFFGGRIARLFPFIYIILVTRSCLIFELPGRLVVTLLSFLLFLVTARQRFPRLQLTPQSQDKIIFFNFNFALLFALTLVFILLLMNTVLSERQSREKLAMANEKLRQYALRIENQATLEERNRIAREIHDSLGHSLTALNLQLETALKLSQSDPKRAVTFLARAKELGSKALQDVRHSVSAMRSNPLQGQSLEQAIATLSEDFYRSTGIIPICEINLAYLLPIEVNTALYRIIQESFTNVSKYAYATKIKLELSITTDLQLMIQDNGRGFDLARNTTGFGLQSMRDRTLALGGNFNISSTPGSGCKIIVNIPLSKVFVN